MIFSVSSNHITDISGLHCTVAEGARTCCPRRKTFDTTACSGRGKTGYSRTLGTKAVVATSAPRTGSASHRLTHDGDAPSSGVRISKRMPRSGLYAQSVRSVSHQRHMAAFVEGSGERGRRTQTPMHERAERSVLRTCRDAVRIQHAARS
jgi:hypothetical protein